jgi:hypothetical protein
MLTLSAYSRQKFTILQTRASRSSAVQIANSLISGPIEKIALLLTVVVSALELAEVQDPCPPLY